jgi:competence protein ComEC
LYDDRFDVGKQVIAPFLWKNKINKIDLLILTHPDPDHLNGLIFVARYFNVDELWDSGQEGSSPAFQELMAIVKDQGIRRTPLFRGDPPREMNGVIVQFLHPPKEEEGQRHPELFSRSTTNNRSMVLRLVFGREAFLFAGDIEKEAESEIVQSGIEIASPILKVPHHGSLSSSTPQFVARVRPEIAIINVRQRNPFLPAERFLNGMKILAAKS